MDTETWVDASAPADIPGGKPGGIAADGAAAVRLGLSGGFRKTGVSLFGEGADGGDEGG